MTLALHAIETLALTEGVKFLYAQASEIIKWFLHRKSNPDNHEKRPGLATLPPALGGRSPTNADTDDNAISEEVVAELRELKKDLTDVNDGTILIQPDDTGLLGRIDAFRLLLESIYNERLTFRGEKRQDRELVVRGQVDVGKVLGYAAAVRASPIQSGTIEGRARADEIGPNGQLIGVDYTDTR